MEHGAAGVAQRAQAEGIGDGGGEVFHAHQTVALPVALVAGAHAGPGADEG